MRDGLRLFSPILAGATLRERVLACLGALLGIGLTGLVCGLLAHGTAAAPLLIAPMGASAVLLFAVPASPLAQPWPIVGGNTISAIVGLGVVSLVREPALALGLAVALAILAMSFTRSLHPPGGATALVAALSGLGGKPIDPWFPLVPVAVNAALLTGLGMAFHALLSQRYPHRPQAPANPHLTGDAPAALRSGFNASDVDAALADLHETLDIDRGDIEALLRRVEHHALLRRRGHVTCADIMSRHVVSIARDADPAEARDLLLAHRLRILPVLEGDGRLAGTVGLRELASPSSGTGLPMSPARVAAPDDAAVSLLPDLIDGTIHAAVVVDGGRRVVGILSQTDLLASFAKALANRPRENWTRPANSP